MTVIIVHWKLIVRPRHLLYFSGFQHGVATQRVMTIFGAVASRYFVYTAVSYLFHSSFRRGSLGDSGLMFVVQKRLKTSLYQQHAFRHAANSLRCSTSWNMVWLQTQLRKMFSFCFHQHIRYLKRGTEKRIFASSNLRLMTGGNLAVCTNIRAVAWKIAVTSSDKHHVCFVNDSPAVLKKPNTQGRP